MAAVCNGGKTCRDCKEKCFSSHHNNTSNSAVVSFFKSMDAKSSKCLEIPSLCAQQIRSEGCSFALLEGPNGCLWDAILCCCDTSVVAFRDGWRSFVVDHSIQPQDIVVFRYMGNAHFLVQIFDANGNEKQMANANREMCTIRKEKLAETADSLDNPSVCSQVQDLSPKSQLQDFGPQIPEIKGDELKFSKAIVKSAVTRPFWLSIPESFARSYLPYERAEVLLLCHRRKWRVTYVRNSKCWFGTGWKCFVFDNQVKIGDTCLFELKDREKHVFTVKILRA